jgi:GrpB-like predicted nucleotidyltransferase (UPF0157 family)
VAAVGDGITTIEHIGSTSVPGLSAKPIIDILATVESYEGARELIAPLEELGYVYCGEFGIPRRHYFDREDDAGRDTHHLHVLEPGSAEAANHLLFRNHLRANAADREAYAALKRELIAKFAEDRAAYTEAKAAFIQNALARARQG